MQLDPRLTGLIERLGWTHRASSTPGETVIGDYARGYLFLEREQYIQVARRAVRGEHSLKMWTPDPNAAQKYVAFCAARLVTYYEARAVASAPPIDPSTVAAPFTLDSSSGDGTFVTWGDEPHSWAGFGRGNTHTAVQFTHYADLPIETIIERSLAGWTHRQ